MEIDQQARLRVVSLNLGGENDKHGAWPARVAQAADTIRGDGADIVLLQAAVVGDDGTGPLPALRDALPGYRDHAFAAAQRVDKGWFGSAAMSCRPLMNINSIPLTCRGGEDDNARVLLHLTLEYDGRPLHFINAHFSWVAEQAADNLAETLQYAAGIEGDLLLVGDLNQSPGSTFAHRLTAAGWHDVWPAHHKTSGFTFETGNLRDRIDQLWMHGEITCNLAEIEVLGADDGQPMSDHLALAFILKSST